MQQSVLLALLLGPSLLTGCTPLAPATRDTDTGLPPTTPDPLAHEGLCFVEVECYGNILDEPKAPCAMTVTEPDGFVAYDGSAGLELRGRSSLYFPKPQYAVELRERTQLAVWPGSTWAYHDEGWDPGSAWADPGYDDSGWSSGQAPLGYGLGWITTTVEPTVTTWLRKEFEVWGASDYEDVELGLKRTDGVAVYLNGVEVVRERLAADAGADSWATGSVPPDEHALWVETRIDPALLVEGTNVLAVELHQDAATPDDLRFDLYLDLSTERSENLLGMGGEADWILNGQYIDRALYRNRLAYDLFQSFGDEERYATETRFCELVLNGEYQGVYTLGERIKRDDDRLPLDDDGEPGDTFIIKLDDEAGFHDNAVGRGEWQLVYPNEPSEEEIANVSAFLADWEAAVTGPDPADPDLGVFGYLDLDSTVDFVIVQELMKNFDAYQLSVHLWKEPDGKMHFTPWDFDLSLGYPAGDCGHEGWNRRDYMGEVGLERNAWIDAIAEVPAFRERLAERWRELRAGVLAEEAILARIEGYQTTLEPAIEPNFSLWPIDSITFYAGGDEDHLCPVASYEEEQARVVDFIRGRLSWMDANIESF